MNLKKTSLNPMPPVKGGLFFVLMTAALTQGLLASENAPRAPFAQWADIPALGQLVVGALYEQSEAYYVWEGHERHNITVHSQNGESYGIDIRQGYLSLDYGITERWAADVELGATTVGWRSFDPAAAVQETTGIMDLTLGVRYQIFNETNSSSCWIPTLTFRAAGILPGNYDQDIAFAPGNRSAAIEPSLLVRKHFGWTGFGAWGDVFYRWMHTTGNDQYGAAIGLFQQIKRWELDVGYRHLQAIAGEDIVLIPPTTGSPPPWQGITYKRDVREIRDAIEAGFSYRTKGNWRWGFHARKTFDGSNTDSKLWLGGSLEIPFNHLFGRGKEAD
jgi:hypothetical protein